MRMKEDVEFGARRYCNEGKLNEEHELPEILNM
jgi:hypothetical protein